VYNTCSVVLHRRKIFVILCLLFNYIFRKISKNEGRKTPSAHQQFIRFVIRPGCTERERPVGRGPPSSSCRSVHLSVRNERACIVEKRPIRSWIRGTVYEMGIQILQSKVQIYCETRRCSVTYREKAASAMQKRLNRSSCCLEWRVG